MTNLMGDRYTCSNANCGCEIEVLRPSSLGESGTRTETVVRTPMASDLFVPPSRVNEPRESASLIEGAGERSGSYGSPKLEREGAFRTEGEEELEGVIEDTGKPAASRRGELFTLTCFCGNPMILSGARSTSARAGGAR